MSKNSSKIAWTAAEQRTKKVTSKRGLGKEDFFPLQLKYDSWLEKKKMESIGETEKAPFLWWCMLSLSASFH